MKRLILIAALSLPMLAQAEITPARGQYDPRVRIVDYNPLNVVRLSTFYGVSTHVQFEEGESILNVSVGDSLAWEIAPRANHLFIRPREKKADTNVTVVTNKRAYQFVLVVEPRSMKDATAWQDPDLIFSLSFKYPDDEAAKAAAISNAAVRAEQQRQAKADMKHKFAAAEKAAENFDYWVAGPETVAPTAARDDGRFIYLSFTNNRDLPAVYEVDGKGQESLINTNVIDGNTIVIQRLVRQLMLRRGDEVASVVNKSFDVNGGKDNTTGTVSPDVVRVIKGAE